MDRSRRLLAPPDVPGAREVDRLAALELQHRGRHRLEEPAVVRDEDHGGVERLQHLLEPLERLDVEVVRRLVEQQQVGLRGERARERRARQLAARERRERPVEVGVGEAEAAHDGRCAVAPVVAARVLELRLGRGVAAHRRRVVRARRHRTARGAQLLLDRGEVGRPGEDVVAQRLPALEPAAAGRAARSACPWRAPVRRPRARPRRRARAAASSCRPRSGRPAPGGRALDLERDAVEEDAASELLAKGRCDDDGHGLKLSPSMRLGLTHRILIAGGMVVVVSWSSSCCRRLVPFGSALHTGGAACGRDGRRRRFGPSSMLDLETGSRGYVITRRPKVPRAVAPGAGMLPAQSHAAMASRPAPGRRVRPALALLLRDQALRSSSSTARPAARAHRVARRASAASMPCALSIDPCVCVPPHSPREIGARRQRRESGVNVGIPGRRPALLLFAAIIGYLLRFAVAPIRRIATATERVAAGDLEVTVPRQAGRDRAARRLVQRDGAVAGRPPA